MPSKAPGLDSRLRGNDVVAFSQLARIRKLRAVLIDDPVGVAFAGMTLSLFLSWRGSASELLQLPTLLWKPPGGQGLGHHGTTA